MRALVKLDRGKPVILRRMQDWWIVRKTHNLAEGACQGGFFVYRDSSGPAYSLFDHDTRFEQPIDLAHNGGLVNIDRSS